MKNTRPNLARYTQDLTDLADSSELSNRTGATLSEALIALAVMAIGVISLASLFPISVLKTAKANQLTISTGIRYNAESMMKVYPWIFSDPNPQDTGPNGIPDGNPYNDYDFAGSRPFLFDPLALANIPGRANLPAYLGALPRYHGGFIGVGNTIAPDALCSGPDTWTVLHEGPILSVGPGAGKLTYMDVDDLSARPAIPWPGRNQMRAQIFYNGGKSSFSRMITAVGANNRLIWTEDTNLNNSLDANEDQGDLNNQLDNRNLPAGITYESARLEARERRYTWLLTIRPQDLGGSFTGGLSIKPNFDVTVVVFFGRAFSTEDEQVYGVNPGGIPNVVAGSTVVAREGSRQFTITWPAGQEPFLKRGSYVFDAFGGYWYQIENYADPLGGTSTTVVLTSNLLGSTNLVAFPKGVVDVFPIKPQSP